MNPLFRIDFSISDSLKIVRKSVLIYETIIYWLIAGMNLPLVLSLWYETENLTEKQLETNISEASEGIVLCNKLLSEDTVEEDDEF